MGTMARCSAGQAPEEVQGLWTLAIRGRDTGRAGKRGRPVPHPCNSM